MKHLRITESIIENRELYSLSIDKYTNDPEIQKEILNEINSIKKLSEAICDKGREKWFFTFVKFTKQFKKQYTFPNHILSQIYNDAMVATK